MTLSVNDTKDRVQVVAKRDNKSEMDRETPAATNMTTYLTAGMRRNLISG